MNLDEWKAAVKALENADRKVRQAIRDQKVMPGGARNDSPDVPRRRMPKVTRMTSARQRVAESQTADGVKAIYNGDFIPTPVRPNMKGTTLNVGANCEPWEPTGKDTRERRP